jgi:hypothetical protein
MVSDAAERTAKFGKIAARFAGQPRRPSLHERGVGIESQSQKPKSKAKVKSQSQKPKSKAKVKSQSQKPKSKAKVKSDGQEGPSHTGGYLLPTMKFTVLG